MASHQECVAFKEDGVDFWPRAQSNHMPVNLLLEAQCETCQETRKALRSQHCVPPLPAFLVPSIQSLTHADRVPYSSAGFKVEKSHMDVDCLSKREAQVTSFAEIRLDLHTGDFGRVAGRSSQ